MKLFESLKKRKFLLFNIFFTLYICINFVGGERGLISYLDKKKTYKELIKKSESLTVELKDLDHKISLINKKYLTKKNSVNYDSLNGRIISIPNLKCTNDKYIVDMSI